MNMSDCPALVAPSSRDFEIQRQHLVEHVSTWRIAEKYGISQTRVRQIVQRVNAWLAVALPQATELEEAQAARLARHLAADQLQSQIEKLQVFWDQTHDPKFLRQQMRAILALAKLGVVPGVIDGLAAEADEAGERSSEVGGEPAQVAKRRADVSEAPPNAFRCRPEPADFQPQRLNPDRPKADPINPPPGDCSPKVANKPLPVAAGHEAGGANGDCPTGSHATMSPAADRVAGLNVMERRLLSLMEATPAEDVTMRAEMQHTLTCVRTARAAIDVTARGWDQGVHPVPQ